MKRFLKNHVFICSLIIFILILGTTGTISVLQSRHYDYHIERSGEIYDVSFEMEGELLVDLVETRKTEDGMILRVEPIRSGKGSIAFIYYVKDGEEIERDTDMMQLTVSKTGMIFVRGNVFDYAGFTTTYCGLTAFFGVMAAYFIWLRREKQKDHYYSFESIAYCAFILMLAVLFGIYLLAGLTALVLSYAQTAKLLILITRNLMLIYSMLTIPFMLSFAIALAISNVELIRHEGMRLTNMLGIGIAFVLTVGIIGDVILFVMNGYGSVDSIPIAVTYAIYSAGFAIFQVLLAGSIITCLQAAYRKVELDKDYIVILGCAIREDGSLFPLIRGRVDAAIGFRKKQLEVSGKEAVLVPSGGQGSDEVISEAQAMKNYLLENGIPEEAILVEDQSTNTKENMTFSKKIISQQKENAKVAYSTTNYHVFRSGLLASQAGVDAEGIGARTKWYFWPNAMIREVIGVFARQSKLQWIVEILMILLAGAIGYGYMLIL